MADSKIPAAFTEKNIPVTAVLAILALGASFAGGALFVADRCNEAENRAVIRCENLIRAHRDSESTRYASSTDVAALGTKIDAMNQRMDSLVEDLRDFRRETQLALRSGGGSPSRRHPNERPDP